MWTYEEKANVLEMFNSDDLDTARMGYMLIEKYLLDEYDIEFYYQFAKHIKLDKITDYIGVAAIYNKYNK